MTIDGEQIRGYRSPDARSIWIRDHSDMMRGFKYFEPDLTSAVSHFAATQADNGRVFDYFTTFPEKLPSERENWTKYVRVPVEADVEYRFVKAAYLAWQASGDDGWIQGLLPGLERGLDYATSHPWRWHEPLGLVKRAYTIDTWDFAYTAGTHDWLQFQIDDDTLWGISGMYLQKPWLWPQLWDANPQIDNPHLIYPGDELYLVWVDGQPRLRMRRGRDVKMTPNMRVSDLDLAIPIIPLDEIGPWLKWSRIVAEGELNSAAYIVSGSQRHLLSAPGDRVFGRGNFPEGERAFGIYRPGEAYYDPLTKELLGYQAQDIGNTKLLSSAGESHRIRSEETR